MFDNILFIDCLQATVGALFQVMDLARTHRSTDPDGWYDVIVALNQILTYDDMKRLVTRSDDNEVRDGFERLDRDVYHTWKSSFIGIGQYHMIACGVSERFQHEERERHAHPGDNDFDPDELDDDVDIISGRRYYLAYQVMSTYYHWLRLHPAAEAVFMHGFMVSASFVF
jgi:hypothetical protein